MVKLPSLLQLVQDFLDELSVNDSIQLPFINLMVDELDLCGVKFSNEPTETRYGYAVLYQSSKTISVVFNSCASVANIRYTVLLP